MKGYKEYFKEWWAKNDYLYGQPIAYDEAQDIFRAGMLASTDIAERMYFHHTPDDGVISGEGIAAEIREAAE